MRIFSVVLLLIASAGVSAHSIAAVVAKVKPGVVGIGLYDALGTQKHQLRGSGFAFGNGRYIATNYHVVSDDLDPKIVQHHVIFAGSGANAIAYKAEIFAVDPVHDLAILKIDIQLPTLKLAAGKYLQDGTDVALTGFPIGAVLGLYPATHKGIVAAVTPDVIPTAHSGQLTTSMMKRLKNPFMVYQLDITAYPGNSGSAVYNIETGEVIAILNKVFIKESKETALEKPSGISYAIPVEHLIKLAKSRDLAV